MGSSLDTREAETGVAVEASAEVKALCEIHERLLAARHDGVGFIDARRYAEGWAKSILSAATKLERLERRSALASPQRETEGREITEAWKRIDHPHRPKEADYEVGVLKKRLAQFPDAPVETLTTWALMQPGQGSFAGALWAMAEYVAALQSQEKT